MAQGSKGEIVFDNDFTALREAFVPTTTGDYLGGGVSLIGVNEGSISSVVDEPGGVIQLLTDTGDDDSEWLVAGVFKPADGGFWMEARFKVPTSVAATREAVFVGFTETFDLTTPVMPAERATATTTYNGSGGMVGVLFDGDSTLLELFLVAGDGGAAIATKDYRGTAGNANGIQLTGAAGIPGGTAFTADRWYIVRIEMGTDGIAKVSLGDYDGGASLSKPLRYVGENTTALGTTDVFHAVCGIENRAGANEELEVDYFRGRGWRDWSAN